ncbi:hypothetical protein QTJ16_003907 [Diplocarpon rosae]|uniref:Uncharacterized protein n=1 Tax=Diplocarpon rosae TaxID=946125 RepID=A0AAD9WCQ6_9HELO|nr:hypothetical protein QTJ16_003907 [Diplocarpon rosae]
MSSHPIRRVSSHYTLFPNCNATPEKESLANAAIRSSLRQRSSEGSVRSAAANILPLAPAPLLVVSSKPKANDSVPTITPTIHKIDRLIPFKLEASLSEAKFSSSASAEKPRPLTLKRPKTPSPPPLKRVRPGPVTSLIIQPYSQKEWSSVMEEVRLLYSKGQYKHCAMRCKQILSGINDPSKIHPLYSIYISFFAASSLEITATTLHNYSSAKLPLLQESLAFYQKAEQFVEYATFPTHPDVAFASRQISRCGQASPASITSSIRSSVSSVFSTSSASSSYSALATPNSPVFDESIFKRSASPPSSSESESRHSPTRRLQPRKKVSFSLQLPTLSSETVLATSPRPSITANESLLDAFPAPPSAERESEREPAVSSTARRPSSALSHHSPNQSVSRYCTQLLALKSQLTYHISTIHTQIGLLADARKPRRSNLPNQYSPEEPKGKRAADGPSTEKTALRERIERLKGQGWNRKRFDGERYRALCERALCELNRV